MRSFAIEETGSPVPALYATLPGALRNYGLVNVQVQKLGASHQRFNIEPQAILHIIRKLIARDQYLRKTFKSFWEWWIHQFAEFWKSPNIAAGYLKIDCNLIGPQANLTIVTDLSIFGKNNLAKRHFYPSLTIYC